MTQELVVNDFEGSSCTVDEANLLDTIQNMGYDLSHEELHVFKNEFEKFLEEEGEAAEDDDPNCSFAPSVLFGSEGSSESGKQFNPGSIRGLSPGELKFPDTDSHSSLGHSFHSDENKFNRDSVSDLIYGGFLLLQRLHDQNAHLSSMIQEAESVLPRDDSGNDDSRHVLLQSNNGPYFDVAGIGNEPLEQFAASEDCPRRSATVARAAVRPVLCPPPGGLPFRHDPVKMLELYKKTWSSNPPPGEKKRLSLRWKVRAFMMRRDISSKKCSDFDKPRKENPEWVPRSYL